MLDKLFGLGGKKKKHQIVVFVTNWCPHCQQMKHQVWTDKEVVKAAKPYYGGKPMFLFLDKFHLEDNVIVKDRYNQFLNLSEIYQ